MDQMAAQKAWWHNSALLWILVFCSAVPLLWPAIPPLVDLPAHMGRYYIQSEIGHSPFLKHYYDFNWALTANLGVDLLVFAMTPLLGVELATKAVVIVIPTMTAMAMLMIAREVHGRLPPTAFFALPLAYNFPFMMGFVNYSMAMALALVALWLWIKLANRIKLRAITAIVFSFAIWISHFIGWAALGLMILSYELAKNLKEGRTVFAAARSTIVSCLPLALPLVLLFWQASGETALFGWLDWKEKMKWFAMLFRDRWITLDILSSIVIAVLLLLTLIRRFLKIEMTLAAPALALIAAHLILPIAIFGCYFACVRFAPYAVALMILSISPSAKLAPNRQSALAAIGLAFFAMRLTATTWSLALSNVQYEDHLAALDHVEQGRAIISFVGRHCENDPDNWNRTRLSHLTGIAIVRKEAFINDQFDGQGAQLLDVHYPQAGTFETGNREVSQNGDICANDAPRQLNEALAQVPKAAFDYLWLMDVPRNTWPKDNDDYELMWHTDRGALFKIAKAPGASALTSSARP
ncbi:hypothetical protein [Sphingobium boeckii]|uniref:Uncharacterized protein n=1 Tax=Sphingobium boeckii TaxID=1082345 RepID=A0A7W9EE98_9SPHN|nr:hypothetical protein [Sphingobium boeckii]MBB5684456.1 hypothetical protein [Sphingobium boeckii]